VVGGLGRPTKHGAICEDGPEDVLDDAARGFLRSELGARLSGRSRVLPILLRLERLRLPLLVALAGSAALARGLLLLLLAKQTGGRARRDRRRPPICRRSIATATAISCAGGRSRVVKDRTGDDGNSWSAAAVGAVGRRPAAVRPTARHRGDRCDRSRARNEGR